MTDTFINDLPEIDEVEPFNLEYDQVVFDEIQAVLKKHSALARFGVTLLHKHFDLQHGERLVESTDIDNRVLTMAPMTLQAIAGKSLVQTHWRFDPSGATTNKLCFADCLVMNGKHKPIHKKNP